MTWNHRVIKRVYPETESVYYEIVEAYYNSKNQIYAWMQNGDSPYGETPEELKADLERMLRACSHPILIEADLPEGECEALNEMEKEDDDGN